MNRLAKLFACLVVFTAETNGAGDDFDGFEMPFDVAKGDIATIASGSISKGDRVDCSADTVSWNNGEDFSRGLSIWLSTTSDIRTATKDDHAVRLSAEYSEEMGGRNHWFSVLGIGLSGTMLHVFAAENSSSFRMILTWSQDGTVFYSVHPGGGTASVFRADSFSPEYWLVTAEGVTGTVSCKKAATST